MGQRKCGEEFKAEAVRQVVERGYRVSDVAARVGAQSLQVDARISANEGRTGVD